MEKKRGGVPEKVVRRPLFILLKRKKTTGCAGM